jgi:diaminopimelate epimerase
MHGLGNDFMVMDWPRGAPPPAAGLVRRLADRRQGVGFDQLLTVAQDDSAAAIASYRVFNADGREVEQCGNGVRCIASWLFREERGEGVLEGAAGAVTVRVLGGGEVSVDLGEPDFRPAAIPLLRAELAAEYTFELGSETVRLGAVSMGNPHAVIDVDSVDSAPVGILGPLLETHADFPAGVNVGFKQRVDRGRIRLRVHERGVGETLACGTGAAAAVAVGRNLGQLDENVEVELPGGRLSVRWPGPGSALWQTGATSVVYEGQIEL